MSLPFLRRWSMTMRKALRAHNGPCQGQAVQEIQGRSEYWIQHPERRDLRCLYVLALPVTPGDVPRLLYERDAPVLEWFVPHRTDGETELGDAEGEPTKGDWRWCFDCNRVYRWGEQTYDADVDGVACPYPDCGGKPGVDSWSWHKLRTEFPDLPEEPVREVRYHLEGLS